MRNRVFSRRDFLKIVAAGGVAGLALRFGIDAWNGLDTVSETRMLMGTVIDIKVVGQDPKISREAVGACLDRMEELEGILSRFKVGSQLSHLNGESILTHASPAIIQVLQRCRELSQLTDDAFDITMKPVLDLYLSTPGVLPTGRQVKDALSLVDYRKVDLDRDTIAFERPGMSITLDGIAKGFIVDEGVKRLHEFGFGDVMVEAGGDLAGSGEKAPEIPWKIGIQSPRAEMGQLMATFEIRNQAIATSGDYMQAFTSDFANHHIIDPRTGRSSQELASVSVLAPTATLADGLATAVMVLGAQGLTIIEGMNDCEAYAITKDLKVLTTSGLSTSEPDPV